MDAGSSTPCTGLELRPYQKRAVLRIEASNARRILVASPTGSGKTIIAMSVAERAVRRDGARVTFLAPRHELIAQLRAKLDAHAPFRYGVITATDKHLIALNQPVQVASVDTLVSRAVKRDRLVLPSADIVIADEAHLYLTELRTKLLQLYPQARIIGFTATPGRYDGRALGVLFDELQEVGTVRQLTTHGYLVDAEYYAPSAPDLARVRTVAGDYNLKDIGERMQPLLGDIVQHWLNLAPGRRTVVFATNVEHSSYLAQSFRAAGVAAEHIDGTASEPHRDAVFGRFRSGETQVLCNCDIATYGFDLPEIDCVVMARPTRSVVRYLQMLGRGLRTFPGKHNLLVLDHAGNVHEHGYAIDDRYWSLDGSREQKARERRAAEKKRGELRSLTCPDCKTVFSGSLTCPKCGYYFERMGREYTVVEGLLVPISTKSPAAMSEIERMRFYTELLGYCVKYGKRTGFAAYCYRDRIGSMPPRQWITYEPTVPSIETMRYVRSRMIRAAKSRQRNVA